MTGLVLMMISLVPRSNAADTVEPAGGDLVVTYQELTLRFPATGWTKLGEDTQVRFRRIHGPGQMQLLAVWPVDLAPQYWSWTRTKHVTEYFEHERKEPRSPDVKWSGFKASERTISGVKYPVLNFHVKGKSEILGPYETNGLFLLIFPDDFETRHRFFVAMWQDTFAPGKSFAVREDLHKIVSRLVIGPPVKKPAAP